MVMKTMSMYYKICQTHLPVHSLKLDRIHVQVYSRINMWHFEPLCDLTFKWSYTAVFVKFKLKLPASLSFMAFWMYPKHIYTELQNFTHTQIYSGHSMRHQRCSSRSRNNKPWLPWLPREPLLYWNRCCSNNGEQSQLGIQFISWLYALTHRRWGVGGVNG